jgi:alkylation response protein AidB-like acyl-CoA dehydrogenase
LANNGRSIVFTNQEMTMTSTLQGTAAHPTTADWAGLARELGRRFDERAADADAHDRFVADNYEELKSHRFFSAGVPQELGGGGLDHEALGAVVRELGRHCASTALAFAMHTHQVATAAWRWKHQKAPVEGLLKRVAAEQLVLLSSGGSDWLMGSGKATRVEGGFRIDARKVFASGAPAAGLFLTTAVHDDPKDGPTILHFAVPMQAPGVKVLANWRTLGMRGTGSNDVVLDGVFVPDAAIAVRRPRGRWHPSVHLAAMIAIPLIYSVYLGVAESTRDIAIARARNRAIEAHLVHLVGKIENELTLVRLAVGEMYMAGATNAPGAETTSRVMTGRALAVRGVLEVADLALEIAGGGGFFRDIGLERRFRDAQACRFHPMQDGAQLEFAGRRALGLDLEAPAGQILALAA